MPREITHWKIAEEAAKKLKNTVYEKALLENRNCLMVGAVFHDCMYYSLKKAQRSSWADPDILHGANGEDTYHIIRCILNYCLLQKEGKPGVTAFLVGIISHIHADIIFHPLINYFSDNYHSPDKKVRSVSIQIHRRLETLIDIFFCQNMEETKKYSLNRYLRQCESPISELLGWMRYNNDNKVSSLVIKDYESAFRVFTLVEFLSKRAFFTEFFVRFERIMPEAIREISALFYCRWLTDYLPRISGNLKYKNPTTGVVFLDDLEELFWQSVENTVEMCMELAPFVVDARFINFKHRGPSMKTGIEGVPACEMKYFSNERFFV